MTPPTWLDASGRRRPTLACWTCGREVAPMRLRIGDLERMGWTPPETLLMPDWCGCSTEYLEMEADLLFLGLLRTELLDPEAAVQRAVVQFTELLQ